ncbi:helix-turn-helix domain-containing protein [Actinomycetaceae bacterium WB03_NA08]|uniref:Helix-turn-helix domain-containing protein n=1 Tax=Scrofimicrobium canadense TaxID=2652290 RepID=A0A6N7VP13_9ACTO|nr:transcriptional regulator [Scrofimicrobium canadense]MSS83437.1 helix-turn-helix domain-containing protein [Scrofimicrobium canadense]
MGDTIFDEVIHAPLRFRICGILNSVERLKFQVLRDTLTVADASLSKNLKVLSSAGYVSISKNPSPKRTDSRRLTWLSLTRQGRLAFSSHIRALREIAEMENLHLNDSSK